MVGETTPSPYSRPVFTLLTHYIMKVQLHQQKQRIQHDFTIVYMLCPLLLVPRCISYINKWCYQAHNSTESGQCTTQENIPALKQV